LNAFLEPLGAPPDAILFNGGFSFRGFCAIACYVWHAGTAAVRKSWRTASWIWRWRARGIYSYVRSTGSGVLVRGGLPRTYYIALGDAFDGKFSAVTLVPRGTEEGTAIEIDKRCVAVGRQSPGLVPFIRSLTRSTDKLGDVVEFARMTPSCIATRRSTR